MPQICAKFDSSAGHQPATGTSWCMVGEGWVVLPNAGSATLHKADGRQEFVCLGGGTPWLKKMWAAQPAAKAVAMGCLLLHHHGLW